MIAFLHNNIGFIILIAAIFLLVLMYYHFKSLPAKAKKKEEKKETKPEPEIKEEVVEIKQVEPEVNEPVEPKVNEKNKSPKVSQIYKRTKVEPNEKKEDVSSYEADYDVEFVNVSKNVSRFKGLVAKEEELKQLVDEAETNEFGFVTDVQENCDYCEDKTSHFDHSRRLSKYIKDGNFDGMFASHISDYYMNMDNIEKHLKTSEARVDKIFDRASKTLDNSEKRLSSGIVEKSIIKSELENMEEMITDEDLKSIADLRTVVITDSIMNRKKKK